MVQGAEERWSCAPDVLSRVLDGEAVLLNLASGTYFGLNEVASCVWASMGAKSSSDGAGATFGELVQAILGEFDVTEDVARRDLAELLDVLRKKGLAVPRPS